MANLAGRKLIDRQSDADDQRRALISLSKKGATLVATVAPESEATYAEIEKRFGTARLRALLAELDDLATTLEPSSIPKSTGE